MRNLPAEAASTARALCCCWWLWFALLHAPEEQTRLLQQECKVQPGPLCQSCSRGPGPWIMVPFNKDWGLQGAFGNSCCWGLLLQGCLTAAASPWQLSCHHPQGVSCGCSCQQALGTAQELGSRTPPQSQTPFTFPFCSSSPGLMLLFFLGFGQVLYPSSLLEP